MLRLKERQRAVLVSVFTAVANLGFGALIFGQAVTQRSFSWMLIAVGFGQWVVLISAAVLIAGIDE
jgi:hypothetical protein